LLREVVEEFALGDLRFMTCILPAMLLTCGVRLRRGGRSVGGRGAGPGFMNCPGVYIL